MRSRVVIPETKRIEISDGDWIVVRKRLTHGETQEAFKRRYLSGVDGRLHVDPVQIGHAQIVAYLVDWSLTNPDGTTIAIKGQGADFLEGALNSFDDETVAEILAAIRQHESDMNAARDAEKKNDPDWRDRIVSDLNIARRCGWRYEWVRQLDVEVYRVLVEELNAEAAALE